MRGNCNTRFYESSRFDTVKICGTIALVESFARYVKMSVFRSLSFCFLLSRASRGLSCDRLSMHHALSHATHQHHSSLFVSSFETALLINTRLPLRDFLVTSPAEHGDWSQQHIY